MINKLFSRVTLRRFLAAVFTLMFTTFVPAASQYVVVRFIIYLVCWMVYFLMLGPVEEAG